MKAVYFPITLLCIALLYACNSKSHQENTDTLKSTPHTINVTSTPDTTALYTTDEYIDWDSIRINGKLPVVSSPKLLYATLGKPDSLVIPDTVNNCISYDKPFKYAYFNGSSFEVYSDVVEMSTLNFRQPGITLTAGKLTLSNNTTLAYIQKFFPKAVKAQSSVILDTFEKVISISVDTGKTPSDGAWILMFKNGKLVQMDYWMPC
jgi:hypothetical protein